MSGWVWDERWGLRCHRTVSNPYNPHAVAQAQVTQVTAAMAAGLAAFRVGTEGVAVASSATFEHTVETANKAILNLHLEVSFFRAAPRDVDLSVDLRNLNGAARALVDMAVPNVSDILP